MRSPTENPTPLPDAATVQRRKDEARAWFERLRDRICGAFEKIEDELAGTHSELAPGRFERKAWRREAGPNEDRGGGVMSLLRGRVFEKVGVNVSTVFGEFSPEFRKQIPGAEEDPRFYATGISLVAHLRSPRVPAVHMNTRHIVTTRAWFGGGADLTPYYLAEEDAAAFHRALRAACDRHDPAYYPRVKEACDEYFFLPHRGEARGVGGIFFDHFGRDDLPRALAFVKDAARSFLPAWLDIAGRRRDDAWGERERAWQEARRGRYVEFNLLYDRGTTFGLRSGGRVESIFMSMPPRVRFPYDPPVEPGSRESRLLEVLRRPRDWA
jgi:coproporphyrinogen III oxidase